MEEIAIVSGREDLVTAVKNECRTHSVGAPLVKAGLEDLKLFLDIFNTFSVVIIDAVKISEASLFEFIETCGSKIEHILVLTDTGLRYHPQISYHKSAGSLLDQLRRVINHEKSELFGFASAPVDVLLHFEFLPFDLYIKCSQHRYVKVVHAYDELDEVLKNSLVSKGMESIYFEKKHNKTFSSLLINNLINRVEKDYHSVDAAMSAIDEVYNTARGIVQSLGFKPRIIEVCESVMQKIMETIHASKSNLADYLGSFTGDQEISFKYRMIELTCLLSLKILDEDSSKGENFQKIVFAALFCDIGLSDPGHLHVRRNSQLVHFDQETAEKISSHAGVSSGLVAQYPSAPAGVEFIIKQHHGSLNGVGLPEKFDPSLHPLAKCFIVAQEISYGILVDHSKRPLEKILQMRSFFLGTPLEDHYTTLLKSCCGEPEEEELPPAIAV